MPRGRGAPANPAPCRTITGGATARSTTVVGAAGHGAGIDDEVEHASEGIANALGVVERLDRAGQDQRRRQDRLAQLGEQRLRDRMVRDAHADGAALRVLEAARDFARRRQQERERAGRTLPDDPELPVVEPREMADRRKIAQHQRQVVLVVEAANLPDAPRGHGVAEMAAERVARIGRIRDDAAVAQDRRRLPDQARLRVGGVNLEELGHARAGCRRKPE